MDWKLPATAIILLIIVSMGSLPFFMPKYREPLTNIFDSIEKILNRVFSKETPFEGNINFYLEVDNFSEINFGNPVDIFVENKDNYIFKVDGHEITIKKNFEISNFTGIINFKDCVISGSAFKLESDDFRISNSLKLTTVNTTQCSKMVVDNIKIAELSFNSGYIEIEKPQKIEAEINNSIILSGVQGSIRFENNSLKFNGICTKIKSNGFEIG